MFTRLGTVRLLNKLNFFNQARWLSARAQSFDKKKLSFYRQFIRPGDLCFDIGANIGQKIELFLRLGAKVVAVEPQIKCFNFLKYMYRNNSNVILVNKALDMVAGHQKDIFVCEANALSSLSPDFVQQAQRTEWQGYRWDERQQIMTTTLDALIAEFGLPAYCKIDVEGYEFNVIRGLHRLIPTISFESTPVTRNSTIKVIDHLSGIHSNIQINWVADPTFSNGIIMMRNSLWTEDLETVKNHFIKDDEFYGDIFVRMKGNKPSL
ncbi:MAG: FkbM family methyltransferase [Candidatus Omnitrophica bacterium]|nr:FkbM family methyltransferase [Candidatus Omnitrophota bacterium]